jgi:hypothetical protein
MTYSDWREELILTEGAKTRFIIKGLKKIKGLIKKPKITKASGVLNVDPELIKQFPGVNIRKLAYPDYKANRNPKLAKAIKIFKNKLERAKMPSSSPYSTYDAPKVEIRSPIPPKLSQQIKSNLSKGTKLTDNQKDKNFADYVKSLTKKVKDKNKVKKNLKTYEGDNKYYPPEIGEEVMAAPTNNVGGGQIAGTIEAGDNPPVKKKKRYIYGGTGSRKMWLNNK